MDFAAVSGYNTLIFFIIGNAILLHFKMAGFFPIDIKKSDEEKSSGTV